ncbi:thiol reductase thioredoxin [Vaginisenegalia massiliensis]|uniref:thiol reductase thioredoxin n=1 Tax=Vaginisenegalia massiliensis TaxID=2058294 RepID=UPI000F534DC3|nr:thiol reductase thioredoxin [Vaginisenegalia massiliensis]
MTPYQQATQHFKAITVSEIDEAIAQNNSLIIYLGRETCPYCRLFVEKLARVQASTDQTIHYLNAHDFNQLEAIQLFRQKYGIQTVPSLINLKQGQLTIICDSSLSEEAITQFIQN